MLGTAVLVGGTMVGSAALGPLHAAKRPSPASLRKSRREKCAGLFVMEVLKIYLNNFFQTINGHYNSVPAKSCGFGIAKAFFKQSSTLTTIRNKIINKIYNSCKPLDFWFNFVV
jgi:hypothetical protein